ncbi:putative uncharacterized protein DDB_G0278921 isoform X4 [Adelges cooleyi]|uniref:putative uncharacterized protein DDB_G0278921 isoform X1 n=1 Tax=Adelges cooleyi TaxID=133065 RepID=UPI00217F8D66|nr:putative uncharacterized protein DDB_G0278921 isoform X1 [Adelges cooleyi]XP_050429688.1 putative uncharacterized protein DDB_G0278921 isoform X1 [Adelges cooleyi]XP_050429689.1 putative uncharacterized protein DDB_G0278921 isoform X2 [Adelges cooleyi]XP_050429690.1 putative uncharacterized protein DDB_G0278921 isoform X3 [Adelges cooleyi]XP_050429691.1 putative uncharacterized protein DDB_G0278921 isoform X4 [Adelges cooleyi]
MVTIKMILLLSLATYVACGGYISRNKKCNDIECGGSSRSNTPNTTDEQNNDFGNTASVQLNSGNSGEQYNNSGNNRMQFNNFSGNSGNSGEQYNNSGNNRAQYNNFDHTGDGVFKQCGLIIEFKGDALWIDGKKVPGVKSTVRPLVIDCGGGCLYVNNEIKTIFNGTRGEGIINFINSK